MKYLWSYRNRNQKWSQWKE